MILYFLTDVYNKIKYKTISHFNTQKSKHNLILNSERSDAYIDFTMMRIFIFFYFCTR